MAQGGNLFPVGLRACAEVPLEEAGKVECAWEAETFRRFPDRNRRVAQLLGDGRRPKPVEKRLGTIFQPAFLSSTSIFFRAFSSGKSESDISHLRIICAHNFQLSEVRGAFVHQQSSWSLPGNFMGRKIRYNITPKPIKSTLRFQKTAHRAAFTHVSTRLGR